MLEFETELLSPNKKGGGAKPLITELLSPNKKGGGARPLTTEVVSEVKVRRFGGGGKPLIIEFVSEFNDKRFGGGGPIELRSDPILGDWSRPGGGGNRPVEGFLLTSININQGSRSCF